MRRIVVFGLTMVLPLAAALAQTPERVTAEQAAPIRRGGQAAVGRARLEQQLAQQIAQRARVVLNLTDDQMTKLQVVDARFEDQQRALDMRENATRRGLLQTLRSAPSADQERRAGELFDQLLQLQHQRVDALQAEQKDLSGFLSNTQRARYHALRENLRRQMQAVAAGGAGRRGQPPPP